MSDVYTVQIITDENDDLVLPIPDEIINELGWEEGDTIEFTVTEDGDIILTLVLDEEEDNLEDDDLPF